MPDITPAASADGRAAAAPCRGCGRSYIGNMATYLFVDGFNLYYGCLRGSPYKWLDLETLSRKILPNTEIDRIFYFTARVSPRPRDPDQNIRQATYLRALATNPKVEIVFGHFLSHPVTMAECDAAGNTNGRTHRVLKTEEKGSDVNLATYMLIHAARNAFTQALIISNDSDLLTPVRFLREEFGKRVGILNPHRKPSQALSREADFIRPIRPGALQASQFPVQLRDRNGAIRKPATW